MTTPMDKKLNRRQKEAREPLPLKLSDELKEYSTLEQIRDHYAAWLPKYQEFSQGRSDFQIEKLIATEQVTPAASYQHTLFQLRSLHQSLMQDIVRGIERTREIAYKWKGKSKDEPLWWEQEQGGKKLCWYDTDQMTYTHEMEELKMSVRDKIYQIETLTRVLSAMEEKNGGMFTRAQLNAEEPEYWKMRFARQMADEYLDRKTGLGTGNIRSLRMAIAEPVVAGSKNVVEDFPDVFNAVLSGKQSAEEVMNEINEQLLRYMNALGTSSGEDILKEGQASLEKLKHVGIGISKLED